MKTRVPRKLQAALASPLLQAAAFTVFRVVKKSCLYLPLSPIILLVFLDLTVIMDYLGALGPNKPKKWPRDMG